MKTDFWIGMSELQVGIPFFKHQLKRDKGLFWECTKKNKRMRKICKINKINMKNYFLLTTALNYGDVAILQFWRWIMQRTSDWELCIVISLTKKIKRRYMSIRVVYWKSFNIVRIYMTYPMTSLHKTQTLIWRKLQKIWVIDS